MDKRIMRTIVLGPPGTGKTTTLLNKVDDYLKQTDPDKIGYFAFTQKAAHEARDRAMKQFNLEEDDLPYFRTLHSLAFRKLGLKKDQVMQKRHYKDLGSKLGFPVGYAVYQEDHDGTGCTFGSDSEYLRIIQLAQLKNITIEQQYDLKEHVQDLSFSNLRIISNELKRYKKEYSLIDYNDMILDFTKSDKSPKFDVVFIDEAQDLSLMQWEMARSIWKKTEDSFIAGDDDQAIYKWAGADVDSFIALKGQYLPLTQSYRIPAKVHGLAMGIINRIRNRIDKTWQPKVNEGTLQRHFDVDSIDMTKGDWLVLSRTRHMLTDIGESLYRQGLYYKNKYKRTNEQGLHEAATAWEYLRQGQLITYKQVESISKYMGPKHWHAKKIKGMAKESFYGIDQLVKDYGLQVKTVWYEAFDEAGQTEVDYLRKMRKNGEKLNEKPRIELSTIHGAKGGEATNVVLLTDLTENTMRSYERNPDDENRLFYVGATRTKENLHIIEPKKYEKGYLL
jgi:DNA helicase II / ATP-dependent DNA helicase PcrA